MVPMRARADMRTANPVLDLSAVGAGVVFTVACSVVVAAATAIAVRYTTLTETYLSIALYYLGLLTVVAGAAYGARRASRLGWLHGGFVGLVAATVAMLLSALGFPGGLATGDVFRQALLAFLAGCIGGIIGVNL